MIDWIETIQGIAAIFAVIFATMVAWWPLCLPGLVFWPEAPNHARIAALEQFDRDTRLLVLDRGLVASQSARHALAGNACGLRVRMTVAADR